MHNPNLLHMRGGEELNRRQRIRICGNLLQLIETAGTAQLREIYRRQYVKLASRLQKQNAA